MIERCERQSRGAKETGYVRKHAGDIRSLLLNSKSCPLAGIKKPLKLHKEFLNNLQRSDKETNIKVFDRPYAGYFSARRRALANSIADATPPREPLCWRALEG